MTSIGPSAAQSVASAAQGASPQQLLSSAPQMLSSAPQQLGQLLTQFTGAGSGAGQQTSAMPVGFAGTSAIKGINPAGADQPGRRRVRVGTIQASAAVHMGGTGDHRGGIPDQQRTRPDTPRGRTAGRCGQRQRRRRRRNDGLRRAQHP